MKKIKVPRPEIIVLLYRAAGVYFFSRDYEPPPGYELLTVNRDGLPISFPHIATVRASEAVYLLKSSFEISWAIGNLPCVREDSILDTDFGFNGTVTFEIVHPPNFFRSIEMHTARKFTVEHFKNMWHCHWETLVKTAFYEKTITYRQVLQIIDVLTKPANEVMFRLHGVNINRIRLESTN